MQTPERVTTKQEGSELLKLLKKRSLPLGVDGFIEHKESPTSQNVFKLHYGLNN